jgi:hypothetical protein
MPGLKEAGMARQLGVLIFVSLVLIPFCLHAQDNFRLRMENQEYINKGNSLTERFNRMGDVFVQPLKKEVEYIIDHDKWQEYGLRNKKIYLFISFEKIKNMGDITLEGILGSDKPLYLLKIVVYDMLANAIKSAINNDQNLKNHIITLSVDPGALKAAIAETGDPMYNPAGRLSFALMDSMNANYHFFFEAFKNQNKIALSGRIDVIQINHEIASTYNYEIEAPELFEKYFQAQPFRGYSANKSTKPGNVENTRSMGDNKIIIDYISCKNFTGQCNDNTKQIFSKFLSILSSDDHYPDAGKDDIAKQDEEAMKKIAEELKKKFGKKIELGQLVDSTEKWKQQESFKSNRLLMFCQAGDKANSIVNKIFFSVELINCDGNTDFFTTEWYKLY